MDSGSGRLGGSGSDSDWGGSTVSGFSYYTVLNLTYYLVYSLFYLALSGLYLASMGAGFLENIRNIAHLASDQWLNMITACALFAIGIYFLFFPILDKVKPRGVRYINRESFGYVFALSMRKTVEVSSEEIRTIFGIPYVAVTKFDPF